MEALCRLSYSGGRMMIATAGRDPVGACDHVSMRRLVLFSLLVLGLVACQDEAAPQEGSHLIGRAAFETPEGLVRTGFLEVADDDEERGQGLMGRTELDADSGMVFVFDGSQDGSFWMKDTLIPLSVAFWDDRGTVLDILEMDPCEEEPCRMYSSRQPFTHALEMNAGWFRGHGIEIGDPVELTVATE